MGIALHAGRPEIRFLRRAKRLRCVFQIHRHGIGRNKILRLVAELAGLAELAELAELAGLAGLAGLAELAELAGLAGLAGLAVLCSGRGFERTRLQPCQ